ncbi:MAG: Serine/threonine-protein kinase pkn3 [Myxococcales bacterium]|nr:Serine/threonine-protein kinase pkn3 [Myxococcales bacterium]
MQLAPGTILLGKYRIDDVIGTGGMGRVVRASHLYLQQAVAIKILLQEMAASPSTVARFLREAQATVRLKSEHIARVIDVGTMPDGIPFMVMEYLEGNDLNQILRHHGPQLPEVVCDLMLQACEGMAEAHAMGIVHRDIKPSNFYITQRPDGSMLLKILDFGISKTPVGYEDLTGTQTVIGTPTYMSPEQMKSGRDTDARSDIWSMGVVIYQLLQGQPPFSGESYAELVIKVGTEPPSPIHVQLPAGLGEVILRCLEKDPRNRLQNVGELARMLAPFASDPTTGAQIAARTTRILAARHNQPNDGRPSFGAMSFGQQGSPLSAGGGLAAPVPLSPAHLTPRTWPPSTSTSQGRGQMTQQTRGSKGWLVAGALSLVILASAGGYIANNLMKDSDRREGAVVEAPPPAPVAAITPDPTPPAPTPPVPTSPEAATGSATPTLATGSATTPAIASATPSTATGSATPPPPTSWKPTVPQPTIAPKIDPPPVTAKPVPKPTPKPAIKATPKPVTKPTVKPKPKPVTKPTTTTPPKKKKGDLFDRRD